MPFLSMVWVFTKAALAAIPAMILASAIMAACFMATLYLLVGLAGGVNGIMNAAGG